MKLPKFTLTIFKGDPLKWTSFIKTFDAAVDSQESLSTIEKFSYLTGHLEGLAADYVRGFSVTRKNYLEVRKFLEERFSNRQVIISTHMNVSLKLLKLNNDNVVKLTSFYNAIESNLRSLMTVGLNPSHYGPLLISAILERLPESIKLVVTRNHDLTKLLVLKCHEKVFHNGVKPRRLYKRPW